MDKKEIIAFFDNLASVWDKTNVRNEEVIAEILAKGGLKDGLKVLDVACGTGVLFPDYQKFGADITGIDISENMVKTAREKFPDVKIICGDATDFHFDEKFDVIMIYNAFPHFDEPGKLIKNLAEALNPHGRLSIAHGISERELAECHSGCAKNVSVPLVKKETLADMLKPYLNVDITISDNRMYMVSGVKKV